MNYYTKHSGNNIQRFHDLEPILRTTHNKSILDIGSNIGMLCLEAYKYHPCSYIGIEPDEDLHRSSSQLLWGLKPRPKIYMIEGESNKARSIISKGYDFIFLLSVIQYLSLEKKEIFEYLDFLLDNTRETLVIRATNYQLNLVDYINNNNNFKLSYFSSLNPTNVKTIADTVSKHPDEMKLNYSNMSNVFAFVRTSNVIALPLVKPSSNLLVNNEVKKNK